jgi:hypothetical protein
MRWLFQGNHLQKPQGFVLAITGLLCLSLVIVAYLTNASHPSPSSHPAQVAASAADTRLLVNAEQVLIRNCMRRHGFAYWPIPASLAYPVVRFPYVITSVSWARRHGFSGALMPSTGPDPNQRYTSQLTATQQTAYSDDLVGPPGSPGVTTPLPTGGLDGHSADGCQATADTELYGNYTAWLKASSVALDLPTLWQAMVFGDRRYISAVSVWSACMQAKGYRYSSPAQAAASAGGQPTLAAVAEAQCAGSTCLARVAARLSREFEARVSRDFRSSLQAEWRLERSALPRARQILRSQLIGPRRERRIS